MNKEMINDAVIRIENALGEVQALYYKKERYVPAHLDKMGLDNITGNASFYNFMWYIEHDEKKEAMTELQSIQEYLRDVRDAVETYKPIPESTWRGFDADVYYPVNRILSMTYDLKDMIQ